MMPEWIRPLIGIPFVERGRGLGGGDCWNIVQLGLQRGFGIEVPSYTEGYETTTDREEIARLVARESLGWMQVPVDQAKMGDVIFLRIRGEACHAGLVLDPPWFLHALRGACSCLERWDSALWRHRISAVYRHPKFQEPALAQASMSGARLD